MWLVHRYGLHVSRLSPIQVVTGPDIPSLTNTNVLKCYISGCHSLLTLLYII